MRIVSKTLLAVASIALFVTACKKSEVPTERLALNAFAYSDSTSVDSLIAQRTRLLTDTTWRYYEYYTNFAQDSAKLVWKYGKTNNALNLSLNRTKFNTDGSYVETTETGALLYGNWSFDSTATQLTVTNWYGTFVSTIKVLTADRFEWEAVGGGTYGVEVRRIPTTDLSQTAMAKITGKTWKYESYFTNYPLAAATLAYHVGKPNPSLDLHLNRVTFFADSTYTEISETGQVFNGTWYLSNNDTRITVRPTLFGPSFTSDIKVLTSDRYEWNRLDNNFYYYGELVPAQ